MAHITDSPVALCRTDRTGQGTPFLAGRPALANLGITPEALHTPDLSAAAAFGSNRGARRQEQPWRSSPVSASSDRSSVTHWPAPVLLHDLSVRQASTLDAGRIPSGTRRPGPDAAHDLGHRFDRDIWLVVQFSVNAAYASPSTIPDQVPIDQRGAASGLVGLAQALGPVLGVGLVSFVVASLTGGSYLTAFLFFLLCCPSCSSTLQLPKAEQPPFELGKFIKGFWVSTQGVPGLRLGLACSLPGVPRHRDGDSVLAL